MPRPAPTARPVLFDLDGTLIDTIELLLNSVQYAFRDRPDRAPTREDWVAGIGTPLASQLRVYAADNAEARCAHRGVSRLPTPPP